MLLVVDFSDLDLEFDRTDIRLDSSVDFTVGKLLKKLCDGIEELGDTTISNKLMLDLLDPNGNRLDATCKVKDILLNDWDTIYISRRTRL